MRHSTQTREVRVPAGQARLCGDLTLPAGFEGLVLFAHGSGSGRHSARNRRVAAQLQQAGIATLLLDLLTLEEEQADSRHRFDMALLTQRLQDVTAWVAGQSELRDAPVGYFGASTGAAAAMIAAARLGQEIAAVVSRGGRPDLAGPAVLAAVKAPTLFIVGSGDPEVMALNDAAYRHLRCARSMAVVPGATHLFEEQGALEQVAEMAGRWFGRHFAALAQEA